MKIKNQEMNVFEMCRRDTKMTTDEMLLWLGIDLEHGYNVELGGRYLRRIGDGDLMEFSCLVEDFDRWANSRACDEEDEFDLLFDLKRPSERRAFLRFIEMILSETVEPVLEMVV